MRHAPLPVTSLAEDLLPPLETLVSAWTTDIAETADDTDGALSVAAIAVDLPVELQLVEVAGALRLHGAPPTQKIETSVMPVWHRLRVRYTVEG